MPCGTPRPRERFERDKRAALGPLVECRCRQVGAWRGPAGAALVPVTAAVGASTSEPWPGRSSVGDKAKQQKGDFVGLGSVVGTVLSPIPEHLDSTGRSGAADQQGWQRRWDRSEHGDNDALACRKPEIVTW